jgi:hypothetical protein
MATTYTTTVTNMYTIPNPTGYVVNVYFNVSGTDGTYTANILGEISFTPEQGETGFIPYNELTQDEVIDWINSATDNQVNYYANVQGQINSMITPPVSPTSQPLPWSA